MDIKLLALDLDGTLLTNDKFITETTADTLRAVADKGIPVVITTGRLVNECRRFIGSLPMVQYGVFCTGALVRDLHSGETLAERTVSGTEARRLVKLLDGIDIQYHIHDPADDRTHAAANKLTGGYLGICMDEVLSYTVPEPDFAAYLASREKVYKIFMGFRSMEDIKEAQRRLAKEPYEVVMPGPECLEINPAASGKDVGLQTIAEKFSIKKEQIMAIGDSDNDLPLLRYAGLPVCMANGSETAKACAAVITEEDNDHDGAAKFIRSVLL